MAFHFSPKMVTDGLQIHLDSTNIRSYPKTGTDWTDLVSKAVFIPDNATPTFINEDSVWDFENSNQNNFKCFTNPPDTKTQQEYTRIIWFNPESVDENGPYYIFLNRRGNNSDMAIGINNSKLCYHSFTDSQVDGVGDQDYTLEADTVLETGRWYMGAMTVSRSNLEVKLYVNGVLDKTHTSIRPVGDANSNDLLIAGADTYIQARTFDGLLNIVQHYNRVLSEDEIAQNFNAFKSRYGL